MDGQVAVIEEALAVADVPAESIGMVEAHGTGRNRAHTGRVPRPFCCRRPGL